MTRPVLANLGFIMQIAGMLMILPILLGFYFEEFRPLISYFTTSITFFGFGFLLNAFSKREDMDFKSAAILISSVFFLLGLVGSIPYLYLDIFPGTAVDKFTNSYFESLSGYTTAGVTLISDIDSLPQSLIFYRSLTQWIGGVGIVFILLAFFYPRGETLLGIGRVLGLDKVVAGMKLLLSHILTLYAIYVVIFIGIFYLVGFTDLVRTASLSMSALATGGLSSVSDFTKFTNSPAFFFILLAMFMGALNFFIHDKLLSRKIRHAFKTEFFVFVIIILAGISMFFFASGLSLTDSIFNVVAASTTAGFSTIDIAGLNDLSKLILIFLMFVGGMTFSTAGGLKVLRLVMFVKAVPWMLHKLLHDSKKRMVYEGEVVNENNMHVFIILPGLVVAIIFLSIFVFVLHGFTISDALFETVSSYSLTGFSTGAIDAATPLTLKWWLILLFVVGRVEIMAFLMAISSRRVLHRIHGRYPEK